MTYFDEAQILFGERLKETTSFLTKSKKIIEIIKKEEGITAKEEENIIKSNIALMQYNILESSFLELYKSFYVYLKECKLPLDSMNKDFIYNIYKMIKRAPQKKYDPLKKQIDQADGIKFLFSNAAMSICFELCEEEKKFLVNGNLDGNKIKEFMKNFGIDTARLNELNLSEIKLLKDRRQLLAHGGSSFSEVGREVTWEELDRNINTIKYLFETSKTLLEEFCFDLDKLRKTA